MGALSFDCQWCRHCEKVVYDARCVFVIDLACSSSWLVAQNASMARVFVSGDLWMLSGTDIYYRSLVLSVLWCLMGLSFWMKW